jgi:hypothetical protein
MFFCYIQNRRRYARKMGSVKKKNVNLFGKKGKKMQKLKNHGTQTGISDASKKKS